MNTLAETASYYHYRVGSHERSLLSEISPAKTIRSIFRLSDCDLEYTRDVGKKARNLSLSFNQKSGPSKKIIKPISDILRQFFLLLFFFGGGELAIEQCLYYGEKW